MSSAKEIIIKPISATDANKLVKKLHYSGKVAPNSQLHLGVFLNNRIEGVMQFGPSIDKRKTQMLVNDTGWNNFIELNRMAFSDTLPKNSESRAISIAMRMFKKTYPHIEWVISFADATQCGDGAIYRASGFVLTGIKANKQILDWNGKKVAKKTLDNKNFPRINGQYYSSFLLQKGEASYLDGYQLRYVYFLNPAARNRLSVPEIPFDRIAKLGAGMYKGKKVSRAVSIDSDALSSLASEGGAIPTTVLHSDRNTSDG